MPQSLAGEVVEFVHIRRMRTLCDSAQGYYRTVWSLDVAHALRTR